MTSQTVLIAIDASDISEQAFNWYIENIHRSGNKLVILHSVDLSRIALKDDASVTSAEREWSKQDQLIRTLEAKYRWKLNEIGITGKMLTASGKPGDVILKTAKDEHVNMIVMGSRGLGLVKRTLAGSVSDHVLHHASCPVVICKLPSEPCGTCT